VAACKSALSLCRSWLLIASKMLAGSTMARAARAMAVLMIGESTQVKLPELLEQRSLTPSYANSRCATGAAGLATVRQRHASKPTPPTGVLYSEFLRNVRSGSVAAVRFEEGTDRLYYDLRADAVSSANAGASVADPNGGEPSNIGERRVTRRIKGNGEYASLIPLLESQDVDFGTTSTPMTAAASRGIFTAMILWLPMLPLLLLLRSMMQGRGSSKSKDAKQRDQQQQKRITFSDVAGVDAAQTELVELVECLTQSAKYKKLQARLPTGVLLVGPPGSGKTLLAKAVAGEAGVPFYSVAASEFVEMFVGRGAARVRDLFSAARKSPPAVVFIDEIDAIGGKRGAGMNEERDQTLNQLLVELDGFAKSQGILVMAATNRSDTLDTALLRPGRFSRKIYVALPDIKGREEILKVHLREVPLDGKEEELAHEVAERSSGTSGADLANVVNEATLLAARDGREEIRMEDLLAGLRRTRYGIFTNSNVAPAGAFELAESVQRLMNFLRRKLLGETQTPPASAG